MTPQVFIAGSNVEGNITSCKIENQLIKVDRKSVLSPTEVKTYISYDVCNKQVINTYTLQEWRDGIGMVPLGIILALFVWKSWNRLF